MAEPAVKPRTVADFLAFEDGTDRRHELIRGAIVAMAPPSRAHGALVSRLTRIIGQSLRPPCDVVNEAGIVLPFRDDTYYQADLAVTCQPARPGEIWLDAPSIVVEVLSPSTEAHDRLRKLPDYRRHPAIQEVVLVASAARRVEHWQRAGDIWTVREREGEGEIRLAAVPITIDLAALYDGLPLEPEEEAPPAARRPA